MTTFRQSAIIRNLELRARILRWVRRYFTDRGYLEVETPCRMPAPAPEAHIDAQDAGEWFLQTSPELCMKRLLAAGCPRLYQICRCFRRQERGRRHLPEFTLLEWYHAGYTYLDLMKQCEDLIRYVARQLAYGGSLAFQGEKVALEAPWPRMTVRRAFDEFGSLSMEAALAHSRFDEIMGCDIEPNLGRGRPLFLYDYPAPMAALAALKPDDPTMAQRFELYMEGIELCNGFTELIDPEEQRTRFESELSHRRRAGKAVYPLPEKFLTALGKMPPAAGNALGLDRLVMLFADAAHIDAVVAFTPEEL